MKQILIETSARHVHVTPETLKVLFGPDAKLEVKKMLSQNVKSTWSIRIKPKSKSCRT